MKIVHNSYFEGNVQSLGHVSGEGKPDLTIGAVNPGEYNFGFAARHEEIVVLTGFLVINGQEISPGRVHSIPRGTDIYISTTQESTYLCSYRD